MKLSSRLRAVELAADRLGNPRRPAFSVCDRIEVLTALFMEHPPVLPPAIEAGILAAVEREERAASTGF